tara:strand:- start:11 stop:280 length:270 start_codon:yes stop_codon:yes gene_type:complete
MIKHFVLLNTLSSLGFIAGISIIFYKKYIEITETRNIEIKNIQIKNTETQTDKNVLDKSVQCNIDIDKSISDGTLKQIYSSGGYRWFYI